MAVPLFTVIVGEAVKVVAPVPLLNVIPLKVMSPPKLVAGF